MRYARPDDDFKTFLLLPMEENSAVSTHIKYTLM